MSDDERCGTDALVSFAYSAYWAVIILAFGALVAALMVLGAPGWVVTLVVILTAVAIGKRLDDVRRFYHDVAVDMVRVERDRHQ